MGYITTAQDLIPVRPFDITHLSKPHTTTTGIQFDDLVLEIGCGNGYHPIQYALKNPNDRIVAIERTIERFSKFHRRYLNHQSPQNLIPVRDDAVRWVAHHLPKASLKKIFFIYPNPNPKNQSQRWIRMPFFHYLWDCLRPNGEIVMATNIEDYALEWSCYLTHFWNAKDLKIHHPKPGDQAVSTFEKKYLERQEKCVHITAIKG
jgi:tRNA (guanine-N7-)-methyltransferase